MRRRNSRIKAMMVLYHQDLMKNDLNLEELEKLFIEAKETLSLDEIACDEEYFKMIVEGVNDHLYEIDKTIAICLKKYTLDRLSYVDRNLVRIGTYELKYTDTPKNIVINEIIDLSHDYSEIKGFESSKFNNSLLESIARRLENGK